MAVRNIKRNQTFRSGDIVFLDDWVKNDDNLALDDGRGPFIMTLRRSREDRIRLRHADGRKLKHHDNTFWNPDAFKRDEFLTAVRRAKKEAAK